MDDHAKRQQKALNDKRRIRMKRNEKTERNRHIYKCRVNGVTYRMIAKCAGISICRVRQIIEAETRKQTKAKSEE